MAPGRSIEKLIEDQVHRWQLLRGQTCEQRPCDPVISICSLPGCSGRDLAEELARRTQFDLFDREIIDQVAQSSHLSAAILDTVDDKDVSWVEEWVESLFLERYVSGDFMHHLCKVLATVAHHGRAVILGRGAGFILPPGSCLRVLLVAPLDERIRGMAQRHQLPYEEAKRQVMHIESDRRAFVRRHFHAELLDPTHYDLVLNTAGIGQEGALAAISAAWAVKQKLPRPVLKRGAWRPTA
ncbi:MAG: cytidylate kinase-like family protein [Elusimicrobiota bacterium]|jgi:cytidylate kinase